MSQIDDKKSWVYKALPAITLMLMAPLIAEVLPGATRVSSLFVFPIEVLIWGSGTVLIRFFVRKYRLGWLNLVLLATALSLAEELLIQQTSFAPLAIQMNHADYGRLFGVNTVYLVWAVIYEVIFVVCAPIALCEMLFPSRKAQAWLNAWGVGILMVLFIPASYAAWFGWNVAFRVNIQHLAPYSLPLSYGVISVALIVGLILTALGPTRRLIATPAKPLTPPHPIALAIMSVLTIGGVFALEILAFGVGPEVPVALPLTGGIALILALSVFVPRWMASPHWSLWHSIAMIYGAVLSNFIFLFASFIGASALDLYGKVALDSIGTVLMLWLAAFALAPNRKARQSEA
ncbi:hypothetical protein AEAC466_18875 [Asticcacaulis sp. AC466]|uniref:hypothetical protein n=1 Tax=Asticcacaulis sp. AC466 TaxID=1282362 RepID=UPI0003C3F23E|nr:hypothetical protein [Asticcacaulis sp. AC466]ESQ82202.1 hypothetical protein AEAC466_18875 [Asticcacaulis sp. AC466]